MIFIFSQFAIKKTSIFKLKISKMKLLLFLLYLPTFLFRVHTRSRSKTLLPISDAPSS